MNNNGKPPIRLILGLLGLLVLFYFAGFYMLAAILDVLHEEGLIPGTEETWRVYAGLLRTIPQVIGIAISFIWGILADRYGRRRILLLLGVLMGIGLLGTGVSTNYYQLLGFMTLFGVAMTGISPVIYAFVADVVPSEKRGMGYAVYYASSVLGMAVGLIIAGILLGWRIAYMATGVLVLVLVTPLFIASRGVTIGYAEKAVVGKYRLSQVLTHLKTPSVLLILLLIIPWTIPWGMLSLFAVDYLQTRWGISKASASLVVSLSVLSIAIGHVLGGVLSDRRVKKGDLKARPKISIIGIIIGYVAMVSMLSYPYPYGDESFINLLPPALLAIAGMMFTTFAYPNISSVLSDVVKPEYRGTIFAIYNVLNTSGWALGPFIYPLIVQYLMSTGMSERDSLLVSAISIVSLWLICIFIWLVLMKTYPRDKEKVLKG